MMIMNEIKPNKCEVKDVENVIWEHELYYIAFYFVHNQTFHFPRVSDTTSYRTS